MAKYDKHGRKAALLTQHGVLCVSVVTIQTTTDTTNMEEKGITYHPRWQIFTNFLEDMGERPEGTTIDRIDNEGNYCKENCRWATRAEQDRNKAQTKMWTYNGKTMCQQDWAAYLGINQQTLSMRDKKGWPIERILSTPGRGRKS
jgi:hypothetical protein